MPVSGIDGRLHEHVDTIFALAHPGSSTCILVHDFRPSRSGNGHLLLSYADYLYSILILRANSTGSPLSDVFGISLVFLPLPTTCSITRYPQPPMSYYWGAGSIIRLVSIYKSFVWSDEEISHFSSPVINTRIYKPTTRLIVGVAILEK